MSRMMLIAVAMSMGPMAIADVVTVRGKMLDDTTQGPIAGVEVGLFKLVGIWKFWTLPEQELVASTLTDAAGHFVLTGEVQRYYIVEISRKGCMLPYKKVFDSKEDGNYVGNLEALIRSRKCYEE